MEQILRDVPVIWTQSSMPAKVVQEEDNAHYLHRVGDHCGNIPLRGAYPSVEGDSRKEVPAV